MFELCYKIVENDYDDFIGENGFFQIRCNNFTYGEIYSEDIEEHMYTVSIFDWFERLVRVLNNLETNCFVALSDVESYNTWIVFERNNENITISIEEAEKLGTSDVELKLNISKHGSWINQIVDFRQMKREIIKKVNNYVSEIINDNNREKLMTLIFDLHKKYRKLQ